MSGETPSLEDILNGPALPPPENVDPVFDNPPNNNAVGYVLLTIMLVIGTMATAFRLSARWPKHGLPRLEDCFGAAAFILFVAYLGCAYKVLVFPGFYVHQWNVRVRDMSRILYPFNIASNTYNGMVGAIKTAIILEWMRIFNPAGTRNLFFWTCHAILWVNILYYSASFFAINLACFPREKIWDITIAHGSCINQNDLYLSGTIVNIISDVAILLLPQKIIWTLNMSLEKRIGVSLIFAIGLLCCGIAAARIHSTVESATEPDAIYNLPKLVFLGTAEMLCALLVFCVPAFPQGLKNIGSIEIVSQLSLLLRSRRTTQQQSWDELTEPEAQESYPRDQSVSSHPVEEYNLSNPHKSAVRT